MKSKAGPTSQEIRIDPPPRQHKLNLIPRPPSRKRRIHTTHEPFNDRASVPTGRRDLVRVSLKVGIQPLFAPFLVGGLADLRRNGLNLGTDGIRRGHQRLLDLFHTLPRRLGPIRQTFDNRPHLRHPRLER